MQFRKRRRTAEADTNQDAGGDVEDFDVDDSDLEFTLDSDPEADIDDFDTDDSDLEFVPEAAVKQSQMGDPHATQPS
jgi:hypothetical protein